MDSAVLAAYWNRSSAANTALSKQTPTGSRRASTPCEASCEASCEDSRHDGMQVGAHDGALFAHDGALVAHDGALFARHDGALFARLDVRAPARHGAFVSVGGLSVPDTLLSAPVPVPVPARVGVQRITTEHCSRRRPRR